MEETPLILHKKGLLVTPCSSASQRTIQGVLSVPPRRRICQNSTAALFWRRCLRYTICIVRYTIQLLKPVWVLYLFRGLSRDNYITYLSVQAENLKLHCGAHIDLMYANVQVIFFDDDNEKSDASSYTVTVNNGCTTCQGFGEFWSLSEDGHIY